MIILGSIIVASAAIIVLIYTMSKREKRLKGRVATKATANGYYPKFIITSEDPYEQVNIREESDLDPYANNQKLYEPAEPGFGTTHEIMYVKDGTRTYVFSTASIGDPLTWGDEDVTFSDPYTFDDTVK